MRGGALGIASSIAVMAALTAAPAEAVNYPVTSLADSGAGTLRDALDTANGTTDDDSISFSVAGQT